MKQQILNISDTLNPLMDRALQKNRQQQQERGYLGASQLGRSCSRALQYEALGKKRDEPLSAKTVRIFDMGHALETSAFDWLTTAGLKIDRCQENGEPFGFATAQERIRGHVDGIIRYAPKKTKIATPALWECKTMNDASWNHIVIYGLARSKPAYHVQIALYQAYMEESIPGMASHPALLTAVNKDTAALYHELIPFNPLLAQEASDKGVNILKAIKGRELLPPLSRTQAHFECRFCGFKEKCQKGTL